MNDATVERIEADIRQLSLADQLWLMERLAQHIRKSTLSRQPAWESQLAAMAHDPDIQRELQLIEAEFSGTEADGVA